MSKTERIAVGLTAAVAGALAVLGLAWWSEVEPYQSLLMRLPGREHATRPVQRAPAVNIEGQFSAFEGSPADVAGSWPCFRGPDFDNVCRDSVPLLEEWGAEGPEVLWAVDLGDGYAGPAVHNGRVYVLDYDEQERADALRCFSLADGREIWRRWYGVTVKRNHGMSRTVPAVTDKYVVTMGPKCHVMCADAATGDFLWGIDCVREYGTTVPLWYAGQCPLIDGETAVIAPGGDALLIGVDCASGEVAWRTPNPDGWRMSHSSVMPMQSGEKRLFVYCAIGGIVAVRADGPEKGSVTWKTTAWNHAVVAPSPVFLPDNVLFVTAGYGVGSRMFRVVETEDGMRVEELYSMTREQFACEQQTPVYYKGHLFSVLPKDGGALRSQFVCMAPDGTVKWNSGKSERFGLGPFMAADDKLFIMDDGGTLTMIRADTSAFVKLAQARVLAGRDSWGPMALVEGRLLCRDSKRMICLDLRAASGGGGE